MRRLSTGLIGLSLLATSCGEPQFTSGPQFNNEIVDQQYVHRYGVTVPRCDWEESGSNGQVVTTMNCGVVCRQSYYLGSLEGETTYTFPYSDSIEKVVTYSQGQVVKEKTFYLSGKGRSETTYNPPNPTVSTEWYENGQVKSFEKRAGSMVSYAEYYDPNGNRLSGIENGSGVRTLRDTYGLLVFTDAFKDGHIEYQSTYYPNGSPKEVTPYKNGIVEGLRRTYYPGGEPKTIETWTGGKQQGITTIYQNGEKSQEVPYVNGMKNGVGKIYKDGAHVAQEVTYKDDMLHGPSKTYIDNRTATEWYYKGNKVTKGYYDSFMQFTPSETALSR